MISFLRNKIVKNLRLFFPDKQTKRGIPWRKANGDLTHRLNYEELTPDSIVVDLGGYQGQWASDIYSKYQCKVFVFEPIDRFFNFITNRFKANRNIVVSRVALGNADKEEIIYEKADGSSVVRKGGIPATIEFRKFDSMMKELNIQQIDLLKINIEGGEYDLLDYIIATGWAHKINNIQVQFHDYFAEAKQRMEKIQDALSATHYTTYQVEFIWENWKKK